MSAATQMIVHTTGGFSEFGWDSLVAIATGVLAAFTAWLAWSTRQLARETGDDVRSDIRPILIDANEGELKVTYRPEPAVFRWTWTERLRLGECAVELKNVGPGLALNARVKVSVAFRDHRGLKRVDPSSWWPVATIAPA